MMAALFEAGGQIVFGRLLADLVSGIAHWLEDRVLPEGIPLLDSQIIQPNRLHHKDPMAFTRFGSIYRNGTTWAATAAIGAPLLWWLGPSIWLATALLGGAFANQIHYWAHVPGIAPKWVRTMQLTGFLQSPQGHGRHHRPPSDRAYCILTDWLNPWLDRWMVWQRLERVLRVKAA